MFTKHEIYLRSWPSTWSADNTRFYLQLKEFEKELDERQNSLNLKEETAYEDGFKKGYLDGQHSQLNTFSELYNNFLAGFDCRLKEELPQLVSQIIEKIVSVELNSNSETVLSVINSMSKKFTTERPVKIILSGFTHKNIDQEKLKNIFPGGFSIEFLHDELEKTVTLETIGQKIQFSPEVLASEVGDLLK